MTALSENRETIKMGDLTNVVIESVATDKLKHMGNAMVGFFAAFIGTLPTITSIVSLLFMIFLFYKSYLEMKLTKVRLANEGRRESDGAEGKDNAS